MAPLKLTVFGDVEVASKLPAMTAKLPAIPSTAAGPNCSFVPFRLTLNKFAVPESAEVPAKVAVPAVAVNVPGTNKSDLRLKSLVVEIAPDTFSALKTMLPAPPIVFPDPLSVMAPPLAVIDPLTCRLPAIASELVVLMDPVTVRLLKAMPLPLIVLLAPPSVTVPKPPDKWVKVPAPVVAKLPLTLSEVVAAAVTPTPVMVRLLN